MKVRVKKGAIVKEHKTGSTYVWRGDDKVFEVVNKGNAVLESDGYEGELAISTNWDNLVIENEPETIPEQVIEKV
jgi:hypothetical protein